MASRGVVTVVVCMVVLVVMTAPMQQAKAAVTCSDAVRDLSPCLSYLMNGGAVSFGCCNGITTLYGAARTSADRQTVCKCLKAAVNGNFYSGINIGRAAGLPDKCGVHLPHKISLSTDCNKIQ